jgi:cell division protein FtsZ
MPPIWEQQEVAAQEIPTPAEQAVSPPTDLGSIDETTVTEESVVPDAPAEMEMEKAAEPRLILPKKKPLPIKESKPVVEKAVQSRQEVLQFEPVTRGRFEKSEPTIVEGQDLDVPTFLRKNVRVK